MYINNQMKPFVFSADKINNNSSSICENSQEYDRPLQNSNRISKSNRVSVMKEEDYRQMETVQNNMQVILKFPQKPYKEEHIKGEVKEILAGILKEQLVKIS